MDWIGWKDRLSGLIGKYKFVLLILCVGILLMTLPDSSPEPEHSHPVTEPEQTDTAEELEEILSQISGVGKVRVMLTEAAGAETIYQTDEDRSHSDNSQSVRTETVLISPGSGEQGLVKSVTPPVYLGAIVVCQGGGDPAVQLLVSQAVAAVTGIGTDRITVLKMK